MILPDLVQRRLINLIPDTEHPDSIQLSWAYNARWSDNAIHYHDTSDTLDYLWRAGVIDIDNSIKWWDGWRVYKLLEVVHDNPQGNVEQEV